MQSYSVLYFSASSASASMVHHSSLISSSNTFQWLIVVCFLQTKIGPLLYLHILYFPFQHLPLLLLWFIILHRSLHLNTFLFLFLLVATYWCHCFLQTLWGYYCKAYLSISVPLRPRTRPWLRFWRLTSIRTEENANVINVVSPLFTVFLGIIHTYNFGKSMSAWTLEKTTSKTQNQKVFGSLSLLTSWVFDCKCIGGLDMKPQ